MATIRLTGWTAIETAERAGLLLSKAADPTEGARDGLSVDEARAVAAADPSLVFVDRPVSGGRVHVGGGRVWLEHRTHGWIEMPATYDAERVTAEDLAQDSQLRRLSCREVRDIGEPAAPRLNEIKEALTAAGITGLKLSLYVDGAGAVVNDGTCLWTCRPERLLRAAESMVEDGTAERLARLDGDDRAGRYDALCRRVTYLARGNEEARALHERVVAEWREEHQREGNWS